MRWTLFRNNSQSHILCQTLFVDWTYSETFPNIKCCNSTILDYVLISVELINKSLSYIALWLVIYNLNKIKCSWMVFRLTIWIITEKDNQIPLNRWSSLTQLIIFQTWLFEIWGKTYVDSHLIQFIHSRTWMPN